MGPSKRELERRCVRIHGLAQMDMSLGSHLRSWFVSHGRVPRTWLPSPEKDREEFPELERLIHDSELIVVMTEDAAGNPVNVSRGTWENATEFVRIHQEAALRATGGRAALPKITPGPGDSVDIMWRSKQPALLVNISGDDGRPAYFYGEDQDGLPTEGETMPSRVNPSIVGWICQQVV